MSGGALAAGAVRAERRPGVSGVAVGQSVDKTSDGSYRHLSKEVLTTVPEAIEAYTPRKGDAAARAQIRAFVQACLSDFECRDAAQARRFASALARHAHWCWQVGYPLDRSVVFRREVMTDSVLHGMPGQSDKSKATVRSRLYRLAETLMEGPQRPVRVATLGIGRAREPYSAREVTLMRSWAAFQSTDYKRVNASVMLSLALGAGLSAREIGGVRCHDVTVDNGGVLVTVTEGGRPRVVPVLADWEAPLAQVALAAMRPDQYLLLPRREIDWNRNLLANFVAYTGHKPFSINAARMRTTWICHHLTIGTPIRLLADAAGMESPRALGDYLHLLATADVVEARHVLRAPAKPMRPATRSALDVALNHGFEETTGVER